MKRLLYGIKRYVFEMLSLERMSEEYHVLAANYIFLMVYAVLESVFVNTLLYRITPDISIVILYRGITYVACAVTMYLAAYIGRKKTPLLVIRLGGAIYLLMYIVLFAGMNHMSYLMYLTAFLNGTASAFYWSGHNLLVPYYTNSGNRDVGISILGIIQGTATLFVPVISGVVISLMSHAFGSPDIGYRFIFGAGMLIVAGQVWYQRKLSPIERKNYSGGLKLAIRLLLGRATYKYAMCYEFLRGFRDGTFGFILNMLLFKIITSESLVGVNSFLTGMTSIIGAWVYGKLVTPRLRTRYTVLAATVMMAFCSILLIKANVVTVMLFAMVNAFFALFISNIASNTTFDVMAQNALSRSCMAETAAIREAFLALGRVCGLTVVMLFPATMSGYIRAMLLLTASQYFMAMFVRLTQRSLRHSPYSPDVAGEEAL